MLKRQKRKCCIAFLVSLAGVDFANATPPTDVIATLPGNTNRVVATIRMNEVACRALVDPEDWFVFMPSTDSLYLADKSLGRIVLDQAAITTWRDELVAAAKNRAKALAAAAAEPGLLPEAKASLTKYSGQAPKQVHVPSIHPIEHPLSGSKIIPEIQQLNQRLADFRGQLKKALKNAEPAGQTFGCAPEFQYLPTRLKAPNSIDSTVLNGVPPGPDSETIHAQNVGRLADLFVKAVPKELPPRINQKTIGAEK